MRAEKIPEMKSALTKGEAIAVLGYLPVHLWLLPLALGSAIGAGLVAEATGNFLLYAAGTAYMLIAAWRFLRRDFDPLCERPWHTAMEILASYGMLLCFNIVMSLAMNLLNARANPNNQAIVSLADENLGAITAMAVYLAPIVEELMFRAGIFGVLRRYSRTAAYAVSMAAFSLYHVWGYAMTDAVYWLYLVQYLPVSWLLCRCYERTDSIWGSIFLHALINGISVKAMLTLQELML